MWNVPADHRVCVLNESVQLVAKFHLSFKNAAGFDGGPGSCAALSPVTHTDIQFDE